MEHRNYGKIHRLGKEEVEGILVGTCAIQEKVDGANVQIWQEDGVIHVGSRNRELNEDEGFNGFREYVMNHAGIKELLSLYPNDRLYGEWLVRHTIAYKETSYKKFYLFDILARNPQREGEFFLGQDAVEGYAERFGIEMVPIIGTFESPTVEQLMEFVGKSQLGDKGEGIVIKNLDFLNGFGELSFAKIVTENFKEDNAITFGGNNKFSDTYNEMYVVNKYMTLARIQKIMNKIQPTIDEKLDMKHIPRVTHTAYHDLLTEEIWEIQDKVLAINFPALKRCAFKKAKQIYVDILNSSISVADANNDWQPID